MAIKKLCIFPNCNELTTDGKSYCDKHYIERTPFKTATRTNAHLYNTTKWRKLRAQVIEAQPYCSNCNCTTQLQVHHIIAPRGNEELFYDFYNLVVVCINCHSQLTAKEVRARNKKQ